MRGTHPHRHLPLGAELVDRDDLASAADARPLDNRETDPAAAEHCDGLPRLHSRAAQRCTHTGQDAAADECRLVERQIRVDFHQRILVQQHLLGIARNTDELAQWLAILG